MSTTPSHAATHVVATSTMTAPHDRLGACLAEPTARRLLLLIAFGGALWAMQSLLVFALAAVGVFGLIAGTEHVLARRLKRATPRLRLSLSVALLLLGAGVVFAGAGHLVESARLAWSHIPALLAIAATNPLWIRTVELFPAAATMIDTAKDYAAEHAGNGLAPQGPTATLWRWGRYVCEWIGVMLRTKVTVAMVNALLTLPLLAILGMPDLSTLTAVVFVGSLVPVVGNMAVGVLLALIAGSTNGLPGAMVLVVATAVLHNIESYFITPRLAAAHLALPSLAIIGSLIVWEHLLGLRGFFVSLPALVVLVRLRGEFLAPGITPDITPDNDHAAATS